MAVRHASLILATVAVLAFQAGGAADPHPAPVALRQHVGDDFQLVLSSGGDGRLNFQLVGCGIRPAQHTGWTTGWTQREPGSFCGCHRRFRTGHSVGSSRRHRTTTSPSNSSSRRGTLCQKQRLRWSATKWSAGSSGASNLDLGTTQLRGSEGGRCFDSRDQVDA